jgi:hypothetical protein
MLQMVIRANSHGFTDVWLGSSDRLCMALGPGAGNTNVGKRVDPKHLSHMGKLVRWLDEDIGSFEVGWM